jgi:hypothetical protein
VLDAAMEQKTKEADGGDGIAGGEAFDPGAVLEGPREGGKVSCQ